MEMTRKQYESCVDACLGKDDEKAVKCVRTCINDLTYSTETTMKSIGEKIDDAYIKLRKLV